PSSLSDNYFISGGHSLTAMQMVARVCELFGVRISLREFFDDPTLTNLVQAVHTKRGATSLPPLPAKTLTKHAAVTLTDSQAADWSILSSSASESTRHNAQCVHIRGHLDRDRFLSAFRIAMERHEILRTKFIEDEGGLRQ